MITRASLVVGSHLDSATIANPHIRAHALEGELFRSALDLFARGLRMRGLIRYLLETKTSRSEKRGEVQHTK